MYAQVAKVNGISWW